MEADRDATASEPRYEYKRLFWGDLIYGSKADLQRLGLAVGMAFPGEPGAPKRRLRVRDSRGFVATIEPSFRAPGYCVSIPYPDRERFPGLDSPWLPVMPGVVGRKSSYADKYRGTPDALIAAGLVLPGQFPGQPGMRKTRVVIYADGTIPPGQGAASAHRAKAAGAKAVERDKDGLFTVSIFVSERESSARCDVEHRAREAWEARLWGLGLYEPLRRREIAEVERFHRAVEAAQRDPAFRSMLQRLNPPSLGA